LILKENIRHSRYNSSSKTTPRIAFSMTPEQKKIQELEAKLLQMQLSHERELKKAQAKVSALQS